jgi:hypothetical protein
MSPTIRPPQIFARRKDSPWKNRIEAEKRESLFNGGGVYGGGNWGGFNIRRV